MYFGWDKQERDKIMTVGSTRLSIVAVVIYSNDLHGLSLMA